MNVLLNLVSVECYYFKFGEIGLLERDLFISHFPRCHNYFVSRVRAKCERYDVVSNFFTKMRVEYFVQAIEDHNGRSLFQKYLEKVVGKIVPLELGLCSRPYKIQDR